MVAAPINLISTDERGIAYISGTRMKIRHIAIERMAGLTPEQIQEQYAHLSLAQIYAALSYYYAHKEEVDTEIEESERQADAILAKVGAPVDREALRESRRPR